MQAIPMKETTIRNEVWNHLLRTTHLKHYSQRKGRFMTRVHLGIRAITLAAAVAGGGYVVTGIPAQKWYEFLAVVIVLTVYVLGNVLRPGKKATVLHFVSHECDRLQNSYQDLWRRMQDPGLEEPEISLEDKQLLVRLTEAAGWAGIVDLFEDSKLNDKCGKAAKEELDKHYSSRDGSDT